MITKKNLFDNIQSISENEVFEELLKNDNLTLERIISFPESLPENKWYDQDNDEWVLLLKGSATLEFENGITVNLFPGDYILLPAHVKHKVLEVDKNELTIWLGLHYK
ncbi:MAG: cupin domain-containing protein [Ignavibacteriae bacterium]|nr:cupin domain-containing protein [Ignavibacteriota bacterium]